MSRPTMYLPSMTTEEVLSYASQYAETELEKALYERLMAALEDCDSLESEEALSWELNDAGEDLVSVVSDIIDEGGDRCILIAGVERYESRVNAAYVKHQRG